MFESRTPQNFTSSFQIPQHSKPKISLQLANMKFPRFPLSSSQYRAQKSHKNLIEFAELWFQHWLVHGWNSEKAILRVHMKLINFFLTLTGLFMVVYGLNHLVKWKQSSVEITNPNKENLVFARRLLLIVHQSNYLSNQLPSAWFPSLLMAMGATIFIISCFGFVGTTARNHCCLSIYSAFLVLLILVEIGLVAFVFSDHKWEKEIPIDKTGCFNAIHNLMNSNWKIMKWIALGAVILEVLALLLALYLRFLNRVTYSRHDDEFPGFQQPVSPTERKPGY